MTQSSAPTRREHLQALGLALLCAVLFLRSALLPGNALVPHPPEVLDVPMAEAIAAGRFDPDEVFRGNVGMTDKYLQSLCWDRVMHDRFRSGEAPRWTNDIGGGAPFVPQMAQPWQPINALLLLLPSVQWYGWWFLIHQVLFGWFAYHFLRRLGSAHGAALLALVAAELGLWTQCKLHHNVILTAALSLWPMLSAVHELVANGARERARLGAIGWLGMWAGLSWSTGFVVVSLQATYLTCFAALLFVLRVERGDRLRRLLPVGLGLALGALLSSANMIPILQAVGLSSRVATWDPTELQGLGLEWDHALTACWPDLLSWGADRFYLSPPAGASIAFETRMPFSQLVLLAQPLRPSDQSAFQSWVETSFAVGLVPIAAALAALFDRGRRLVALGFAAAALLSFGIATADQPFFGLARVLPGISAGDLRRQLFTTAMCLVVLTGLGADVLLKGGRRWPTIALLAIVVATSLTAVWWLAARGDDAAFARGVAELLVADADHPKVQAVQGNVDIATAWLQGGSKPGELMHNHAMLLATTWRALLVGALGLAALWLRERWRVAVWLALTIFELLHAGLGPVQTVAAERVTNLPAVLQPAAAAAPHNGDRARIARITPPDAKQSDGFPGNLPGFLGLEDNSAYNPLPPARYEEFMKAIDPSCPYGGKGGAGIGAFHRLDVLQHPLCDLYGIRFVMTRMAVEASATLVDRTPADAPTGGFRLWERTTSLPRATFVQQVDVIEDKEARLAALAKTDRDVAHRVVLEDPNAPAVDATLPANATVTLIERRDERTVVRVTTAAPGYLRLADPWDPGWRATLDGEATELFVADHFLRAVHVPAGEHEVVFAYDTARVVWPLRLTLLAWLVVGALLWRGRRYR
ncbi:MAG: hypothetical protein R3F29_07350 [Planctomycetota bacterium]